MDLTYKESMDVLDINYTSATSIGYTLPVGRNQIIDNDLMLKSLRPDGVKLNITIDDIRLKTNLFTNNTIRFTRNSFFDTILGFTFNLLHEY